MLEKGFSHYVAYTNTDINSSWNSTFNEPDLFIVFSSEEILANSSYSYNIPSGSVLCTVRSNNYSTSNSAINTERILIEDYTETVLDIEVYEHISTNAISTSYTVQPDIIKEGSVNTVYEQTNSILLSILLFFIVFWCMWKIRK